jgi:Flp pilus assembly protein TadD
MHREGTNRAAIAVLLAMPLGLAAAEPKGQWLRFDTPDFELFTPAPERDGRDLLERFAQIRGFFQKASPVPLLETFPVRIIAFGDKEQFRPYSPRANTVAYATASRRTDYIVMQDAEPESYGLAVHEYMHLLVKHSGLRLPVWLNEGWADVYSTLRPVRGGVAVGDLVPERVRDLQNGPWMDFETLTSVTTESPNYTGGIFYAESWALAHMLFLSPEYAENFPKFLIALHRGADSAEACREAWGRSPEQVIADLHNYLGRKNLVGRIFEAQLGRADRHVAVSKITAFDSRLLLADLSATIGHVEEARAEYEELRGLQPDNPRLSESLGYVAWATRDMTAARSEFAKAFAAGDGDARMCYELALLERDAHESDKAVAALERAVQSKPDYADAQLQLGLMRVAAREYQPAIETLMGIQKVTPVHATPLFTALAYAYFETGDMDKARNAALTAKKWALAEKQTSGVDVLLGIIEARSKSAFAPKPGEKVERVEGTLQAVECSAGHARLVVLEGQTKAVFELPEAKSVELTHTAGGTQVQLTCGPQQPARVAVEYATDSMVVRRLEFY